MMAIGNGSRKSDPQSSDDTSDDTSLAKLPHHTNGWAFISQIKHTSASSKREVFSGIKNRTRDTLPTSS
ncbi:hypothetical protein TNCV_4675621 [Trichonephila clavipes]|nr:hypothetical protein TNCV_4675621 [Trichonephila clavipes]